MVINIEEKDYINWKINNLSEVGKEYIKIVKYINNIPSNLILIFYPIIADLAYDSKDDTLGNQHCSDDIFLKKFERLKEINCSLGGDKIYCKQTGIKPDTEELTFIYNIIKLMSSIGMLKNIGVSGL